MLGILICLYVTVVKPTHPPNDESPMLRSLPLSKTMSLILEQSWKAPSAIIVADSGKEIVPLRLVLYTNALLPIVFNLLPVSKDKAEIEVLLKAVLPILVTEAGIIKESLRLDS